MKKGFLVTVILLCAIFAIPSNAKASGSKVWTTTADFDSGNKNDPGTLSFAENGVDQPTYSFISSPNAIYANGKTFVVYQAGTSYLPYMVTYDHTTLQWSIPAQVNSTNPVAGDGHGAPSMIIDTDGFIHVFYGAHDTAIKHRRSTNPYDISSWISMSDIPGPHDTYPGPFIYNGIMWIRYRCGGASTLDDWCYRKSSDGGNTWTSPTIYVRMVNLDAPHNGGYQSDQEIWNNRMYFSFNRLDWTGSTFLRRDLYLCYLNLDNGNLYNMTGTNLGPMIDYTEATNSCRIVNMGTSTGWAMSTHVDSSGNPFIIYTQSHGDGANWDLNFTRWTGSWTSPQTILVTDAPSNYPNFIVNSPTNIEGFFTTNGFPAGNPGDDYSGDMERWTWNGSTWTKQETLLSESKSGKPVNHPVIPINYQPNLRLIFAQFGVPPDLLYNLRLYGWGNKGFVINPKIPSGNGGTETITNNFDAPADSFRLASTTSDKFTTAQLSSSTWKWNGLVSSGIVVNQLDFSNGVLNVNISTPQTGPGGTVVEALSSSLTTAPFDIQAKFTMVSNNVTVGSTFNVWIATLNQVGECRASGPVNIHKSDGILYRYIRTGNGGTKELRAYTCSAGILTQVNAGTAIGSDTFWLRIQDTGVDRRYYYSLDGSAWTLDTINGFSFSNARIPEILVDRINGTAGNGGNEYAYYRVDDFRITTGTFSDTDFRTSGSWTSPIQTFNGEVVKSIILTYSGASATQWIDEIGVVSSTGQRLLADTTKHISGASVNVTFADDDILSLFDINWGIRINLGGNGFGSVVVDSITIYTVRSSFSIATQDAPWLLGFFALLTLGLIGAFAIKRKRSGH